MLVKRLSAQFQKIGVRHIGDFKSKPDPKRVPKIRTPEERFKDAQPKTGTIEDYQLYERRTAPNNINSILKNGFKLDTGARIVTEANQSPRALILLDHEAFQIDLAEGVTGLDKGRVEFDTSNVLGLFSLVHPKPELVVIGLGSKSRILGPTTQRFFRELGMQTDVATTRTAASNYDLLANERGKTVAAFLLPPNV